MAQFHQHPDGLVYVRDRGRVYMDTPENFERDSGIALPALDPAVAERLYDTTPGGARHMLLDAKGNMVASGPIPWTPAERAIAGIATLLVAQSGRALPPPPAILPPPATPLPPPEHGETVL